jgi:hypothetical protein
MIATISRPTTAVALIVIGLVAATALKLSTRWRAAYRRRQMVRIFNEAKNAYIRGQSGLRTMAGVVTQMPVPARNLCRQGIDLLDAYADAAASFKHLSQNVRTMSRDRALRHLNHEFGRLKDYETTLQDFQKEVLGQVSIQAASGTLTPPVPVRSYRAAFTVLRHELLRELWPIMNEVLAAGVKLKMLNAKGRWRVVPVTFRCGSQAVFSRKWLEQAVALQMVIQGPGPSPRTFEFTVEHERPVKRSRFSIPDIRSLMGLRTRRKRIPALPR